MVAATAAWRRHLAAVFSCSPTTAAGSPPLQTKTCMWRRHLAAVFPCSPTTAAGGPPRYKPKRAQTPFQRSVFPPPRSLCSLIPCRLEAVPAGLPTDGAGRHSGQPEPDEALLGLRYGCVRASHHIKNQKSKIKRPQSSIQGCGVPRTEPPHVGVHVIATLRGAPASGGRGPPTDPYCASAVLEITSRSVVTPSATLRKPALRSGSMPSFNA